MWAMGASHHSARRTGPWCKTTMRWMEARNSAGVAGPGVGHHGGDERGIDGDEVLAEFLVCLGEEMHGEEGEVRGVGAEGRDFDDDLREAIEEIGAEFFFLDAAFEVAIGGGEYAGLDGVLRPAADAAGAAGLEEAQELWLEGDVEFADLIEEKCAAGGLLDEALASLDGAGERAFFSAEEFGLDEVARDGGAIDG